MKAVRTIAPGMVLLVVLAGCAAYRFGNASLYPAGIRTIYVPMFTSASFRPNLGERLTEAVIKEIENRTPYKVVADPNADSVLTGRIVGEGKKLVVQQITGDPRELEVNLQVQITWEDRRGNILRNCPPVPVPASCLNVTGTADLVPEVGQSVATAQQEAITRLARQIVSLMEERW